MNENTILNMIENSALQPKGSGFAGVLERINTERERGTLYQPVPEVPMSHGTTVSKAVKGTLAAAAAIAVVAGAGAVLASMGGAKMEADWAPSEPVFESEASDNSAFFEDSAAHEVSDSDVSPSDEQAADDEVNDDEH
ncbi:MAG: hypothetical protein E7559_10350 [Ruminococcaceae bacterium]|nr:hypothetical protein [Oscillospiraceae bacterium]